MKYLYSAIDNAFYPFELKEMYEAAGKWPDAGIDVGDDIYNEFISTPVSGKMRIAGPDGMPVWSDIQLTHEQLVGQIDAQKATLVASAKSTISLWQSELLLKSISDADKASLIAWIAYIKALDAIDTSSAPDITWPEKPKL